MKKHLDEKIDKLLRNSLGNMQAATTPDDWSIISKKIDKENAKPTGMLNGFTLAVIALLLVISGIVIGYQIYNHSSQKSASNTLETNEIKIEKSNRLSEKLNTQQEGNTIANGNQAQTNSIKSPEQIVDEIESNQNINSEKSDKSNIKNNNSKKPHSNFQNKLLATNFRNKSNNRTANQNSKKAMNEDIANSPDLKNRKEKIISESKQNNRSNYFMPNIFAAISFINNDAIDEEKKLAQNKVVNHFYPPRNKIPYFDRLNIVVSLSPTYNTVNEQLKPGSSDLVHKDYATAVNGQSKTGIGFTGGIKAEYRFWKNFSVHAGIQYMSINTNVNYNYTINNIPIIDSATHKIVGYIKVQNPDPVSSKSVNTYTYISIPAEISYGLTITDRLAIRVTAGMDLMLNNSASGQQVSTDNLQLTNIATSTQLQKINYGLQGAIGIEYALLPRVKLEIMPVYHHTVNPLYDNSSITNKTASSFGVQFGIKFGIL